MSSDPQTSEETQAPITRALVETWIKEAVNGLECKLERVSRERERVQIEEKHKEWMARNDAWLNRAIGFAIGLATGMTVLGFLGVHLK